MPHDCFPCGLHRHCEWEWEGAAFLLLVGVEAQNLHVVTTDTPAEEPSLSPWLPTYLASSDTPPTPVVRGSLQPQEGGSLGSPLGPCWHGWEETTVYSVVFGWSRVVIVCKFLSC